MPYKNKEEQKAAQHNWYVNNKAVTRKRAKKWKKNNREKIRAGDKEYRKKNRAEIKIRSRIYERKQTAELTDYYIRKELSKHGIPPDLCRQYPELIQAMREYYATIRLLLKMNKDAKQKKGRVC